MGRRILLACLAIFATAGVAAAQGTGRVVGRVTNEAGGSLSGATVVLVGTTRGATTDTAGRFVLTDIPAGARRIQARRIGFISATQTVNVAANNAATVTFALVSSPIQLEEVKTVGYGVQTTRTVTGAVASVSAEQLKDIPTNDAMKSLQGRVPGVEIVASSNEPGAPMQVRIRGVRSMPTAGQQDRNEPLYVIDGVPISGGIQDFNPAIIENIDVLKDAAATAIYGSRGSNGVILVTTKRGVQDGRNHSSYSADSYYGNQSAVKILQMMNLQQHVQYLRDAAAYAGQDTALAKILAGNTSVTVNGVNISKRLYAYQNNISTDWQRAVLRDGAQKNFQGGLSGASPDTRYSIFGNFFSQLGLIPGQGYNRGAATASVDHNGGRLRVGLSTNLSRVQRDIGEGQGAFGAALAVSPFGQPYNYTNPDSVGLFDVRPDDDPLTINPVLENVSMIRQQLTNRAFGSAYAELNLLQGLNFRINVGPDYTYFDDGCYNGSWTHNQCQSNAQNGGLLPAASDRASNDFAYTVDNLLTLTRDIGSKQHIDATLLYGIQHDKATINTETATNLPYTTQLWYDLGSGTPGIPVSSISEWSLQSYMGRVNYTLLDRYTFSFTQRSDGSSRLAPGHKWATFPSYGLGWQLGDEAFMKRFTFIDNLKVRGSYGTTGNTSISPYATQGALSKRLYSFGGTIVSGYKPGSIPNPDLSWEKTDQSDVGLEFAIFHNRISGSIDGYSQNTHDLLLSRLLPVTSGFTSTLQNVGSTNNKGYEVGISTVNFENWRGLRWQSDFNWSTNKNEITALASGANPCVASATGCDINNGWFVGHPINLAGDAQRRVFFDYKYLGNWQYADSVAMKAINAASGLTLHAGDPRVADVNGDGKLTVDDRTIIGDSYPGWTGSISNRFTYKGWDLSGLVTIKWNYLFVDGTPRAYGGRYPVISGQDYWTPTNPSNANPAPAQNEAPRFLAYQNSRLYTDGSHWRVRNLTLGYSTGQSLAGRIGASSIRVYGTAQDPYIHSSYIGNDPEVAGAAPTVRTILLGTNIVW